MAKRTGISDPNLQTAEQLYRRVKELSALQAIAQAMSSLTDLQELIERLVTQIAELMNVEKCAILLHEPGTNELVCQGPAYGLTDEEVQSYRIPLREETVWKLWQEAPYYISNDVPNDSLVQLLQLAERARAMNMRTTVLVPMRVGNRSLGAIQTFNELDGSEFTEEEAQLLSIFAAQAAMVVENARLYQDVKRRFEQTQFLLRVSESITSTLDLTEVLRRIAREAAHAMDADMTGAHLPDASGEHLHVTAGYHVPPEMLDTYRQLVIPIKGHPFVEQVWTSRQPVLSYAPHPTFDPDLLQYFLYETILLMPMLVRDECIGVVWVLWRDKHRVCTDDELDLLMGLARQAGVAAENARLYRRTDEALEKRVQELTALQRIGRELTTLDRDRILNVVLDEALRATGAPYGDVVLVDRETGLTAPPVLKGYPPAAEKRLLAAGPIPVIGDDAGLHGRAVTTGEVILVPDVSREPDFVRFIDDTQAELVVPIVHQGKVVGVLNVESDQLNAFDEEDVRFLRALADQAAIAIHNSRLFAKTRQALDKLETAHKAQEKLLATVQALSSPVVPIFEGIIVLPLVGSIDSTRAQRFTESLLEGITAQEAQVAIIDITGVPVVDTSVANYLLQAASAARLLGCRVVLVGIRPEVAQTVVQLGVDLTGITTRADLQSGVEYALSVVGQKLAPMTQRQ
jgi:GAF domain-containing protein/anti-anti-sigma regulatory factor